MPSHRSQIKHKAKHKEETRSEKLLCRLVEIEDPVTWITDIHNCHRIQKSTKSILKTVEKQMDITETLDALKNEIGRKRPSRGPSSSSGKRKSARLSFSNVSVFYFKRELGQSSIPSDGGHPLGMGMKHVEQEKMKVSLYNSNLSQTGRVTRQNTEMMKERTSADLQHNTLNTFTYLAASLPTSPLPQPPPVPPLGPPDKTSSSRSGLFQQVLSSSRAPRRMFSSSAISSLRPSLQRRLPLSYSKTSAEFPWRPQPVATRSHQRREEGGLARAFSTRLSVQELEEIMETLPRPENQRSLSTNCVRSFTDYHRSLQSLSTPEKEKEQEVQSSLPVTRRKLGRRARKVEETGGRGGLRLLTARARHLLLRSGGVTSTDRQVGGEINTIQASRLTSGCSCSDGCQSAGCECRRNNIPCHREYSGFPCACTVTCCNPSGRRVFDDLAVSLHFINTMVREGVMDITDSNGQQPSPRHSKRRKR